MENLLQDIRYAVRGLRRAPGFALVAILTLALGIGVNSAIFSVVNAVLFRPLPVERPAELVDIYGHAATSETHDTHSYPNYETYRAQTATLTGLAGYSNFFAHLSIQGSADLVVGELVTDNYFQVLGVRPALGRVFLAEEYAAPGASPVAVISHRLWQSRFAGAADVVGRQFRMNGIVYHVVGVAPPEFGGMMPAVTAQMWIPTAMVEHVEPLGNQRSSTKRNKPIIIARQHHPYLAAPFQLAFRCPGNRQRHIFLIAAIDRNRPHILAAMPGIDHHQRLAPRP